MRYLIFPSEVPQNFREPQDDFKMPAARDDGQNGPPGAKGKKHFNPDTKMFQWKKKHNGTGLRVALVLIFTKITG